jgi:hypothetical protein
MTWFLFVLINQAKYYAQDTGNQYSILGRHSSQLRLIPYLHHTSSVLRYWKYFRNIARNDRWFAHLHIQNGDSKRIWILTYSWTGNFLLAWAGQFSGIKNQTMHRFEQYLKILQLYHENSRFPPSFKFEA